MSDCSQSDSLNVRLFSDQAYNDFDLERSDDEICPINIPKTMTKRPIWLAYHGCFNSSKIAITPRIICCIII